LGILATGIVVHDRRASPKPPAAALVSRSAPSSVKPTSQSIAAYTVPSTAPKYLSIPAITVSKTRIIRLGLTSDNQIAVPDNIYNTGWYDGSAEPGQSGAMFIYGHVSSWTANGVFYNLKKLKPMDQILITRGDNKTYTYSVVSTKVYPYNAVNMSQILAPINPKLPGLNLMTCTGQVIKGTSEFNQRLVVFTQLVSS
jgi:sortase (surface protein transpeptidase)